MATYLPQVQDYIPQIQPFTPDYNFYAGAMTMKQGKYDSARKALSSLYGSLLNAPLTREDNTESRDKFFKAIDQDIQKISGMDLSLAQNVDSAKDVFNQLLDNKKIVKDMVWTKNFQSQMQRAQGFKNCVDSTKCGGMWWDGGERLLYYQHDEFKNATADEAMEMGVQDFVPAQDITKMALDLAKAADLSVTKDINSGQWITTIKNGPLLIEPLNYLFTGSIANNPKVLEYYNAKAQLERKDFVYGNIEKYGSKAAAEEAYINQMAPIIEKSLGNWGKEVQGKIDDNNEKVNTLNKAIKEAPPSTKSKLEEFRDKFLGINEAYSATLDHATPTSESIITAVNNKKFTASMIDRSVAYLTLGAEINQLSKVLAHKDYEETVKVNPYAMEAVQFRNRRLLEELQTTNQANLEILKSQLKANDVSPDDSENGEINAFLQKLDVQGSGEQNVFTRVTNIAGNAAPVTGTKEEIAARGYKQHAEIKEEVRDIVNSNEEQILKRVLTRAVKEGEFGSGPAKEDYVNIIKSLASTNNVTDPFMLRMLKQINKSLENAPTTEEKFDIIKDLNIEGLKIPGFRQEAVYSQVVSKMLETTPENKALREYMSDLITDGSIRNNMRNIEATKQLLRADDEWYAKEIPIIINKARMDPKFGDKWADAATALFNKKGYMVNEQTFIKNMVAKNYTAEEAKAMYGNDKDYDDEEYGVIDQWKRMFSDYHTPDGPQNWFGITGGGNYASPGLNAVVDAAHPKSVAFMSTVSYLKNALDASGTVYAKGDFSVELPDNDEEAQKITRQTLMDLINVKKGEKRPVVSVTYSDVAASDPNKVALNIKYNDEYRKAHGKEETDLMGDESLLDKGVTIYMDKSQANNIFTQQSQASAADKIMAYSGEIPINLFPEYTREWKVEADKITGMYKVSGNYRVGYNKDGSEEWDYWEPKYFAQNEPLPGIINWAESVVTGLAARAKAQDRLHNIKNK
jgi:hypothetical protein